MLHLYARQHCWWCLLLLWLSLSTLTSWAQSTQIQWQRVIDANDLPSAAAVRVVKAATGGYALLAGPTVARLSAAGAINWSVRLTGTYSDSTRSRVAVAETKALMPTPDGGFVVLSRDVLNLYYATKINADGQVVWTRTLASAATGPRAQLTADALGVAPDGSLLVVGTYYEALSYLAVTKLSKDGYIVGQWRIKFADAGLAAQPVIHRVLNRSDGGFLLVGERLTAGSVEGAGVAIQLDSQNKVVWQATYPLQYGFKDAVASPVEKDTYVGVGLAVGGRASATLIQPGRAVDTKPMLYYREAYTSISIANDGTGNLLALTGTAMNGGDFRLTSATSQGAIRDSRTLGGAGDDQPAALLATDDGGYLAVGTTTSTNGDVAGKATNSRAIWVVKLGDVAQATTLSLLAPTYDCTTGAISFNTTGGDSSPITYQAPGITRAGPYANTGTVEPGVRTDPHTLTITATQSGQSVRYFFDLVAYCRNEPSTADTTAFRLLPPTYNCQTGALTFHTEGGTGSPVEYAADGLTSWTTNPNQVVSASLRNDANARPLLLMARRSGRVVTYQFDLKADCGRARIGQVDTVTPSVRLLGNPVRDEVMVEITGAVGQPLRLELVDNWGHLLESRIINQAKTTEQQRFDLRNQPAGLLLLHTTAAGQVQTSKVMKQ